MPDESAPGAMTVSEDGLDLQALRTIMRRSRFSHFILSTFSLVSHFPIISRSFSSLHLHNTSILLLLFISACATPVLPSGGPPDQTPPAILDTEPAANAVNVATQTIHINFSEYVDAASFSRAFSVTPMFEGRLAYRWRGRGVTVRFQDPLRDNTTYIVTLDTNLRDVHGVALTQPLIVAFSTGPTINKGRLTGLVVGAASGSGLGNFDVYAYAAPDSTIPNPLPETPDYRIQTDASGGFSFSYLNEQPYFVLALQDLNRNRLPDPLEPYAIPSKAVIWADSTVSSVEQRWIVTRQDTIPPEVQRIRALSNRRFAARFSESIQLTTTNAEAWSLQDSLTNRSIPIHSVYTLPTDTRQVILLTDTLVARSHRLRFGTVADSSGNIIRPEGYYFSPSEDADTLQLRFTGFIPEIRDPNEEGHYVLFPGEMPGIQVNQTVADSLLQRIIVAQDTMGQSRPVLTSSANGTSYLFSFTPPLQPGEIVRISADGQYLSAPDTLYIRTFQYIPDTELGELSGIVTAPDTTNLVVLELYPTDTLLRPQRRTTEADAAGKFIFVNLPEGSYRLRAFVDANQNGQWDGGTIRPYQQAEIILWSTDPLPPVRARWNTAVKDTLRIGDR